MGRYRLGFLALGSFGQQSDGDFDRRCRIVRAYNDARLGGSGVGAIEDDGTAMAGLICHMVEAGVTPYRERYRGRY
jgi:hypothetical protein